MVPYCVLGLLPIAYAQQLPASLASANMTSVGVVTVFTTQTSFTTVPAASSATTTMTVSSVSLLTIRVPPPLPMTVPPLVPEPTMIPSEVYPPMFPPQSQQAPQSMLPQPMMNETLSLMLQRMVGSQNYSSIFQLPVPSGPQDVKLLDDLCAAKMFCSSRPRGMYCHRPPLSKCSAPGQKLQTDVEQKESQLKGGDCLPVAIIICPEAIFVGCSEGYACHQVPDLWLWDTPPTRRIQIFGQAQQPSTPYIPSQMNSRPPYYPISVIQPPLPLLGLQQQPFYNMTSPQMNVTSTQSGNMTSAGPDILYATAHCMAVIRSDPEATKLEQAALMPTSPHEWSQWCIYRSQQQQQLQYSNFSVTIGSDCMPTTLQAQKIQQRQQQQLETSATEVQNSISTVWWWPGIETGGAPFIKEATPTSMSSPSSSVNPCVPTPPPTCNGPYPYAPRPTPSYLFISVSTTSVAITTTLTQGGSTVLATATITAQASTVTTSIFSTVFQTITAPAPVIPERTPIAPIAAVQEKAPLTSVAQVASAVEPGRIPQEAFPQAGEPYEAYTAKIAAIATIV